MNATKLSIDEMYALENEFDWSYVESEGGMAVRYDFRGGSLSLWIYSSGTAEGHCPKKLKAKLEALEGINTEFIEYV
jgi:hypothetical protein